MGVYEDPAATAVVCRLVVDADHGGVDCLWGRSAATPKLGAD